MKHEPDPAHGDRPRQTRPAEQLAAARRSLRVRARRGTAVLAVILLAVVLAIVGNALWTSRRPAPVAADDRAQMVAAERVIDSLQTVARSLDRFDGPQAITGAALLALGYHERLRIGAGSPFRLADYAMHDTRLGPRLARATAWSILAKTARGESHRIDEAALAGNEERVGAMPGVVPGARQRELIDSVVAVAPSARTGEEAIRLALTLAESERLVERRQVNAGIHAAALARDRRLAMADAARLLAAARRSTDDALTLLEQWRAERWLMVEQPLLADSMQPSAAEATRIALRLLDELRRAADHDRGDGAATDAAAVVADARAGSDSSYLPPTAARRLAELAAVREAPPQAPVAVTTASARRRLSAADRAAWSAWPDADVAAAARRRFLDRALSEESLVAEYAVARAALSSSSAAVTAARADVAELALTAAVALRAHSQESVWFPEFGAPDEAALRARFGLRRVAFDPSIPEAWRPYYRRQLASALSELTTMFPALSLSGLTVRVGESAKRDSALALHDPATRTVYLPAGTGAGTIAHEIAHDLDWQTARIQLALRGAYITDRAARDGNVVTSASLARSVRGLTAARPWSAGAGGAAHGARPERPAELFARGVDWLAAAALAREGRMNGYLTSVQDAALPGYAGVVVPEPGSPGADALVDVLDDMTVLPWETRAWYLRRFGQEAPATPDAVVRLALAVSPSYGTERALRTYGLGASVPLPEPPRDPSRRALATSEACRQVAREPWRAELLWAAAESRARGILRARAGRWTPEMAPGPRAWEAQALLGVGPWDPAVAEDAVRRTRDAILRQVVRDDAARGPVGSLGLDALVYGGCR